MGSLRRLLEAAGSAGLVFRGAFSPAPEDGVPDARPGVRTGTLVLLGFAGRQGFPAFAASPEASDGAPHPLDRWSRRVIEGLAEQVDGAALFPFGGPPWLPFQRWAMRAEDVRPSPLGLLIHPERGLWHSYRGAVALQETYAGEEVARAGAGPCDTCPTRPCLSACPVGAFTREGYDVDRCAAQLRSPAGAACMDGGCLARRACPVGAEHAHTPEQAAFGMRAFLSARV
ncbi:hypothetical protein WDZ92_41540 [Nostoc sp. NIES-2111]